ncbi:class I SAM-dependent methyltransferase [Kiloniella sp. b19]|uniref:class I SAM-dependent methyltransferase n=1 Tax=Kiloniella sp. GXU_MW_B19 TaxID=3141326 RepID=UPI0031E4518A
MQITDREAFIRENTRLQGTPLLGEEYLLWLAHDSCPLWTMGEEDMKAIGLPTPFWAFAWAGGQALAHYIRDNPRLVQNKTVLDFACGCALQGLAALRAGASRVLAVDIDPFAITATRMNAEANNLGTGLESSTENLIGQDLSEWDVIFAGDVCYDGPMAREILDWLRKEAARGAVIFLGDPGRTYLDRTGLERIVSYGVKTTSALEDSDVRSASVWQLGP